MNNRMARTELSWKPVRNGRLFCAPACGGGCTLAAYKEALRLANRTILQMKTTGWVAHVWENLGWHWALSNSMCGMSIHHTNKPGCSTNYWCMFTNGDGVDSLNGSFELAHDRSFKDPNDAVAHMTRQATRWFKQQARGFENLKSISRK